MLITAKDIANKLGLSQPTVSRILNDAPGYRVSAHTRQRVLEAARELGYQPNAVARSLRRRRTNVVGFYSGYGSLDARNDFLAEIIGVIQRTCEQYKLDLLLHSTHRNRSTDDIYGELANGRIDGLFLHTSADDPLVAKLSASSLHVVALVDQVTTLPSVFGDDSDGIKQLISHLLKKGYVRFLFLVPEKRFASVEKRRESFEAELSSLGISEENRLIVRLDMEDPIPGLEIALSQPAVRTAVCCWNDTTAYNLIRICRATGISIPERIGVTGFDGFLDTKMPAGQLTTVRVPYDLIACSAVKMLVSQIEEQIPEPVSPFPVSLLVGDTT